MEHQRLLAASVVAVRSLRTNIRSIAGADGRPRSVLVAGPHQLSSVWTRDFCFCAPGLLAAGEETTVRHTLDEIISRQRKDGLFPRLLDSYHPSMRFFRAVFGSWIPLRAPLVANFRNEHGAPAIDVNALVVSAAVRYALAAENFAWAGLVLPRLEKALAYYDKRLNDGLIPQSAYADWKDTVARRGPVFFTQLLRWKAHSDMAELYRRMGRASTADAWSSSAKDQARRAQRRFWSQDGGYFREKPQTPRLSSEANLAAIAWDFSDETQGGKILRAMDRRGLLTPWGPCAGERYPRRSKAFLARAAGIAGYHDDYVWLWNSALLLRALKRLNRAALLNDLSGALCAILERDGVVSEVYRPENGQEVRTWLFRSERPFSWSAAMLLEAFEDIASGSPAPAGI